MSASDHEEAALEGAVEADTPPQNAGEPQQVSKNAQKKAARAARFAEYKLVRRAREKEARKEKKRQQALKRAAGEDVEEGALTDARPQHKRAKLTPFGARVVVDLAFDEMMTEKEINSLCSQLAYTYSSNRKAQCPFKSLLFTSLHGRTLARLDSQNDASFRRWNGTEWWEERYERLWAEDTAPAAEADEPGDFSNEQSYPTVSRRQRSQKDKVLYLTADADEDLTELKEDETYIIGGICDHNRYKNLCLNKAQEGGIRTAKLPIGRYLSQMNTRKVLTVNQVFDILVQWVESRDWDTAFHSVVPKRKFQGASVDSGSVSAIVQNNEVARENESDVMIVLEAAQNKTTADIEPSADPPTAPASL